MRRLINNIIFRYLLKSNSAFIWDSDQQMLKNINKLKTIPLKLLVGIERQKKTLLKNTINFCEGNHSNSALLWGARGNGKSTLVKSIFNELNKKYTYLKIIQLNKNDILIIQKIFLIIESLKKYKFIFFIDDLSFEKNDNEYKTIKSVLDGSIKEIPTNIILYVTSNRRHLMTREMIENERSSAIHTDESVEEKISLSDRFGIWLGFHQLSQDEYVNIIKKYCYFYNIKIVEQDIVNAKKWSLQRGNRNGRTAWQYLIYLSGKKNLKIKF